MTDDHPQDLLRKVQADLDDVSRRLAGLAADFQQLSRALPGLRPDQDLAGPREQPAAAVPPVPTAAVPAPAAPAPVPGPAYPPPTGAPVPAGPHPGVVPPRAPAPPVAAQPPGPSPVPTRPRKQRRPVSVAEIFSIFGSAITLIGVAFVLVLPQDGVLGPVPRTAIGAVLALAAVGAALWQHARDPKNVGAQALMATGVASAFLCIVAVTVLFTGPDGKGMLPELPGLALAGLVSVGGVWIGRRWNSEWLAVLAILGSLVLAPYIVRENFVWCLAFMVVMTLVTEAFQPGRSWLWQMAARVVPTSVVFLWAVALPDPSVVALPLATIGLAALLAAAGLVLAILHQRSGRAEQIAATAAMVLMAGPLMLAVWFGTIAQGALASAAVGAAFATAGLLERRVTDLVRSAAVPLGATFVAFAILRIADGGYDGYIFFGLAAAYLALARQTRFRPVLVVGFVLAAFGVLHWAPLLATPIAVDLAAGHGVPDVVESLLGLLATLLGAWALRAFLSTRRSALTYTTWALSIGFGTVALVLAGTIIGERLHATAVWFQAAHAAATVSWLLLCVVLLRLGLRRDADAMVSVRLAIALAVAAVAKLFLFDLATLPGRVRAIAFLAVGVLLLVIGTWYNRQLDRVRKLPAPPGTSADELVLLLNEQGRPSGTAPRSAMRAQNLRHGATAVVVRNSQGQIYVHRRTPTKDVYPGRRDFAAGGVITAGENPDTAAVRELAEELGITGVTPVPLRRGYYADDHTAYHGFCYTVVWDGEIRWQPEEVADGEWMTPAELQEAIRARPDDFMPDTVSLLGDWLAAQVAAPAPGPATS